MNLIKTRKIVFRTVSVWQGVPNCGVCATLGFTVAISLPLLSVSFAFILFVATKSSFDSTSVQAGRLKATCNDQQWTGRASEEVSLYLDRKMRMGNLRVVSDSYRSAPSVTAKVHGTSSDLRLELENAVSRHGAFVNV